MLTVIQQASNCLLGCFCLAIGVETEVAERSSFVPYMVFY